MSDATLQSQVDLLDRIESAWEELNVVINGLDEAQLARVDDETGWSVADHLNHLAAWERGIAYVLTGRPRAEGMGVTQEQWVGLTMDEINDVIHDQGRQRGAAAAPANFRDAHAAMLDALEGLGDADLQRGYTTFDPQDEPDDRPIIGWIIGDTYDHYAEHLGYIRGSLSRAAQG